MVTETSVSRMNAQPCNKFGSAMMEQNEKYWICSECGAQNSLEKELDHAQYAKQKKILELEFKLKYH